MKNHKKKGGRELFFMLFGLLIRVDNKLHSLWRVKGGGGAQGGGGGVAG